MMECFTCLLTLKKHIWNDDQDFHTVPMVLTESTSAVIGLTAFVIPEARHEQHVGDESAARRVQSSTRGWRAAKIGEFEPTGKGDFFVNPKYGEINWVIKQCGFFRNQQIWAVPVPRFYQWKLNQVVKGILAYNIVQINMWLFFDGTIICKIR